MTGCHIYRCHVLRVVDEFMASSCWMGLVGDMSVPAEVDKILRLTAVKNKVGQTKLTCQFFPWTFQLCCDKVTHDKVDLIGWVDLTKNGVINQKDVSKLGVWCEKIIAKNPTGALSQTGGACSFQGDQILLHSCSKEPAL